MEKTRKGLTGVYLIQHQKSDTFFVGASLSICNSLLSHFRRLKLGTHPNENLQSIWNENGPTGFQFSIKEILTNKYLLEERELYWIQLLDAECIETKKHPIQMNDFMVGVDVNVAIRDEIKNLQRGTIQESVEFLISFYQNANTK